MTEHRQSHRAAVVQRDGDFFRFSIESRAIPEPESDELLVRLTASGICSTDIALAANKLGPTRSILGHEGVGRVVKIGSHAAKKVGTLKSTNAHEDLLGTRVGIAWVRDICGICSYCLAPGGETRCKEQMNSGRKIDGTFAEYALIPTRYVIPVPEGIADEQVAPILCGGVTAYKALKIAGAIASEWIAILGAGGGVGALAIQYAKAMGYRVIALDIEKENYCQSLGADAYIDIVSEKEITRKLEAVTAGRMAKAAIVTAGAVEAYELGLELLAPFGTLVCVGIPPPNQVVRLHPLVFIDKGIRIVGSIVGTREDIREALDFVVRGIVKPSVKVISMEELPDIVQHFAKATTKYVIKMSEDSGQQVIGASSGV